jgi:hypothetical protein
MAQEYRAHAIEFSKLKRNRAIEWLEFRKTAKSNAEADMLWDASATGQRYHELKALMDGLSKQMSDCAVAALETESKVNRTKLNARMAPPMVHCGNYAFACTREQVWRKDRELRRAHLPLPTRRRA